MTEFMGELFFGANNGESGQEIFVSDGSSAGTRLLANLFSGGDMESGPNGSRPEFFTPLGNLLFFAAQKNSNDGEQLWVYEHTTDQ